MNNISLPSVSRVFKDNSQVTGPTSTPYEAQKSFASMLKQSIEKVNEAQIQSDNMTNKLARGENVDLHQVMVASQKASISLQATMEIRNKVIEAYQEVLRMQV